MGNNCVGSTIPKNGLFPSFLSSLLWWAHPMKEVVSHNHVENSGTPSRKRPNPNAPETVHQKPPKAVKYDNKEMKQVQQTIYEESNKPSEEQIKHVEQTIITKSVKQKEHIRPAEPAKHKKFHNVKKLSIAGHQVDSVLLRETGDLKKHYDLGPELGRGIYGTTFLCWEKATGKKYASKSIPKEKLVTNDDVEDVRREIQIMHHLAGIPNVVSIKGAYEDDVAVHVVMELCEGGELYHRIVKKGYYSERKAAKLARTIVSVIKDCHSLGVMHLDIKPENFLFVNGHEDSTLKAIDFGMSVFFKPGDVFKDAVGSPYYISPEVLSKSYGPEADVWSAGVIIYILLCGKPPFRGETQREIFKEVLHGNLDFSSYPWPNISESAKDMIRKMLVRDPRQRIAAHEVLCHPWIQVDEVPPLDSAVLSRPKQVDEVVTLCTATMANEASAKVIDGKLEAKQIRDEITAGVSRLREATCVTLGLAVILVGDRMDSATIVHNKKKACESVGNLWKNICLKIPPKKF